MTYEPQPALIIMTVIDKSHPRYRQAGRVVGVTGDDERVTVFTLEFSDTAREDFTPAQVRLVRG